MADRVEGIKTKANMIGTESPVDTFLDGLIRTHFVFVGDSEQAIAQAAKHFEDLEKSLSLELTRLGQLQGSILGDRPKDRKNRAKIQSRRSDVEATIRRIQEAQADAYKAYARDIQSAARDLSEERRADIVRGLEQLEGETRLGFSLDLSPIQLKAVAKENILGDQLKEWFDLPQVKAQVDIARQVRMGYTLGDSIATIASRLLKATKGDRVEAENIARSMVLGVANEAAHDLYDRNADVLNGKQWIATLDSRTCPQCGPLDGRVWFYGRAPYVEQMPRAPLHHQCRCFVAPVVKGLSEYQIPTWSDWVIRQSEEIRDRATTLGPRFLPAPT